MIKRIVAGYCIFVLFIVLFLGFYLNIFTYVYDTIRIKKEFWTNNYVAKIDKMVSQKDFEACYDIYITLINQKKFVICDVKIKDNEIIVYKIFKSDNEFNWLDKCETNSHILKQVLNEIYLF